MSSNIPFSEGHLLFHSHNLTSHLLPQSSTNPIRYRMSSEFDFSLENLLREDVGTGLGGNDSNSFNIHFSDFRMLDTATGNFDPVDCEALNQTIPPFDAANALRPSQLGRPDSDVAPNQPPITDASGFGLDAPVGLGESG